MDTAMMKQTMQAAIMMEVTVVEDVPTQTTVQIVSDCADWSAKHSHSQMHH
jgi:hypothetical protein